MKTMFKKTLVAAAVVGFATNAFAVDLVAQSAPKAYSTQTLDALTTANSPVTIPAGDFEIVLAAEYAIGDIVTFTFSNDALAASQLASTVTTTGSTANVTFGLLSSTSTSATYRVTEVSTAASTIGARFSIAKNANFEFNAAKLKAGNGFKATFAAQTSNGIAIDASGKPSVQLVYVADQFAVAAKPVLDAIIDVNADRKKFEGGVTTDALTLTTTNKTGVDLDANGIDDYAFSSPVTFTKVLYTVKGDFSWVKDADTDDDGLQVEASTLTVGNTCTGTALDSTSAEVTWYADKVTVECNTAGAHVLTFNTAQGSITDPVIPVSSFTYDATVTHSTNKSASYASGLNAGAWTLNGSSVFVPYMVYGTLSGVNFSQVLTVANNSSKTGDIKVDVWAEDGKVLLSNVKVGEAKANATTNIAGAVRTALEGAGLVNGKVSMKITTNVPGKAVTVYSAYTDVTSRERAIVNNDSAVQYKGAALN